MHTLVVHRHHHHLVELLDPAPDSRAVDLGCGVGQTLVEVATRLGPDAQLVGVDARERPVPAALVGDPRLQLVVADLEAPLPFEDGQFDRALSHNTLECLTDHQAFLAELWRIVAPGGRLVLGHSDFDTLVFTSHNLELTRRLVHHFCETTQAWMRTSDGTIGRKLKGIVTSSQFVVEDVTGWVNLDTSLVPGTLGHDAAHALANIGRRDGSFDPEAIDDWLTNLKHLAAKGAFLHSVNDYAVVARKV